MGAIAATGKGVIRGRDHDLDHGVDQEVDQDVDGQVDQDIDQGACKDGIEERFEFVHAAGMGFFGIVLFALIKSDFMVEQSRLTSDPVHYDSADGLRKIQAVKICNPSCPSGIRASSSYLIKEIEAMKLVWSNIEERVHHNFAKLYNYSTSDAPWYSMEPVMSGLTLEGLYNTTQAQLLPVPEELAFHIVDQMTSACLFLYEKCGMVCADVVRENVMLRYPGRATALMPDVVLIDWSLWQDANAERIEKDTKGVYEFLCPVLFGGGWRCGTSHGQHACTINDVAHSEEWLHLYNTMSTKHLSLGHLRESIAISVNDFRKRAEGGSQTGDSVKALMTAASKDFTGTSLKKALLQESVARI